MDIDIGNDKPFFLIAGPCQIESQEHAYKMATEIKKITDFVGINLIYKSSFDKANRTSLHGKRGAGLEEGMRIFDYLKKQIPGLNIITDVHTQEQCSIVAPHVDALQIPAFLCRQTDLLIEAGRQGLWINVKKGSYSIVQSPPQVDQFVGKFCILSAGDILDLNIKEIRLLLGDQFI